LRHAQGVGIHLPAGGTVSMRLDAEDLGIALVSAPHFQLCPGHVSSGDTILPLDVIPAMDGGLEAGLRRATHDVGAAAADIRSGQQCAVHQCLDP
jgi:hypothetical protein